MRIKKDLKDIKFYKLTVLKEVKGDGHDRYWLCKCDCGKEIIVRQSNLTTSHTKSCGCIKQESENSVGEIKHGLSKTKIYRVWVDMRARCFNPNNPAFKNYGGRGISVCDGWLNFINFYNDMNNGYKEGLELDRINNDKGYCKENCRWVTRIENTNNRRCTKFLEYNGDILPVAEMARKYNISYRTLKYRLKNGWNIGKALAKPVIKRTVR